MNNINVILCCFGYVIYPDAKGIKTQYCIIVNIITNIIKKIENTYENPFIIAIDSAISNYRNLGDIVVSKESVSLAAGMNRRVDNIGDMSIKGVVAKRLTNPRCNFNLLQNTRLSLVMNMANIVSEGIYNVIEIE